MLEELFPPCVLFGDFPCCVRIIHLLVVAFDTERGSQTLLIVPQHSLEPVADAVRVILGFDQGERNVRLDVEDVVGPLGLAASHHFAADDDSTLREADFLTDLRRDIPTGLHQRRGDEFRADVSFAELLLVHAIGSKGGQR